MNIYGAEVFRYSKSFYGRMIMILVVPFACLTAAFLYYISHCLSHYLYNKEMLHVLQQHFFII